MQLLMKMTNENTASRFYRNSCLRVPYSAVPPVGQPTSDAHGRGGQEHFELRTLESNDQFKGLRGRRSRKITKGSFSVHLYYEWTIKGIKIKDEVWSKH